MDATLTIMLGLATDFVFTECPLTDDSEDDDSEEELVFATLVGGHTKKRRKVTDCIDAFNLKHYGDGFVDHFRIQRSTCEVSELRLTWIYRFCLRQKYCLVILSSFIELMF